MPPATELINTWTQVRGKAFEELQAWYPYNSDKQMKLH